MTRPRNLSTGRFQKGPRRKFQGQLLLRPLIRGGGEIKAFGRQVTNPVRLAIMMASLRLRLTPAQGRDFTKNTGRKLPTLAEAKKILARTTQRLQSSSRTGGGLNKRRGL